MADVSVNTRKFGFSVIEWKIKNFFTATCTEKWVIKSPVFTINGKSHTKWRFYLKENYVDENHTVCAYLRKVRCDSPREPIWVTWKFFFPCDAEKTSLEIESDFEKSKSVGIEICHSHELESFMQSRAEDTLLIRSMIFVSNKDSEIHERSEDSGLKSLSQDLAVLYKVGKNHDLYLLIDGLLEKAYKGILSSRNNVMKKAIERDEFVTELPGLDIDAVKNIFGYLYTGNLDYILRHPSFAMLQCIEYFGIKELETYYVPDEIELCSEFEKNERKFYCTISVEKILETDDLLISSPCTVKDANSFEEDVTFHLYPKGLNRNSNDVSVLIENVNEHFSDFSYVSLAVIDSDGHLRHLKNRRCFGSSARIFFKNYLPRDVLNDIAVNFNGNLHLLCNVYTSIKSLNLSSTLKRDAHSNIFIDIERHYEILSDQMAILLQTGIYSDLTLTCNGEEFRVHSYILSARSYVFRYLCGKSKDLGCENIWDISCMKSSVLKALLYYMYCGKLLSTDICEIPQLYEAAERFCVLTLKYTCSSILQHNIETVDAKSVLTLAQKYKDYKLISLLEKFISHKAANVSE